MKKYNLLIVFTVLAACLMGCKKNTYNVTERTEVTNMALVKIGYFSPSITNQPVQVKVNGVRISSNLTYNTPFPGGGLNTGGSNNSDFLLLTPGNSTFSLSVPKVGTDIDSVKVFETQYNFEKQRQTLFLTDSFPNITGVLVNTETTAPIDSGKIRIKFINLIPNVPAVDFYRGNELLKANVGYKESTEFFDIFAGNASYVVKMKDSTTNLHTPRSMTPAAGRIYVFLCRGYKNGPGNLVPHTSAIIIQ